ncbi:hypothetical protein [Duffyella gerundensis]|jgi:hypothetical protein|uniref:hypothetical protein n=1 Tax=Duffyella gerundensis TaxID=1619313 RepID=UPI0016540CCC|nr:hypothetical protein [Duffyella gerundensis]
MSLEALGGVWGFCAVLPIVVVIMFKAKKWRLCLIATGAAVGWGVMGFSSLSWLALAVATALVASDLWDTRRST